MNLRKPVLRLILLLFVIIISATDALAQSHLMYPKKQLGFDFWFSLLEVPFLILCVVYAFMTAKQMKGGKFGSGMNLLAWGFIVMAAGHIHMQVDHYFGSNLFNSIFGETYGSVVWVVALISTWLISAFGLIRIYKASKGE